MISHVKSHGSAAGAGLESALVLTVHIHEGELGIQPSWAGDECNFGISVVPGSRHGTSVQAVGTPEVIP